MHWNFLRAGRSFAFVGVLLASCTSTASTDGRLAEVCARLVSEVEQRWGQTAVLSLQAEALFPHDVVQRAVWLRQQYEEPLRSRRIPVRIEPRVGLSEFATDRLVMTSGGNDHKSLRVVVDPELQSFRYHSANDVVMGKGPEDFVSSTGAADLRLRRSHFHPHASSRLVISWTAGHVGFASNSGRVANQLKFMSGVNKTSSIMAPLFDPENPLWVESAVSAVDIPFHGAGPVTEKFFGLEESLDFRLRYYAGLRRARHLPLVAAGRSGENLLLAPLAFRHPELFSGMIWVSGMHPVDGYRASMEGFLETGVLAGAPYNPLAMKWFLEQHAQSSRLPHEQRWWEHTSPFKMPVLVLVGSEDAQVSPETRDAFKRMARQNPHKFFYVEVPGGGHDVFAVGESFRGEAKEASDAEKTRAAGAYQYVYWFLKAHVLRDANVKEPALPWRYIP